MVEIRAAQLPAAAPLRLHRGPGSLVQPLARGLVFLAALSLPVLGCLAADRLHGGATGSAQVVAAPYAPPRSGAAANARIAKPIQVAQAKLGRSLDLR